LVEAVIEFARPRVELIQLSVVMGNEPARRLYARAGFVEYGVEKNSLKHGGRYYDEILMAKDLTVASDHDGIGARCSDAAIGPDGPSHPAVQPALRRYTYCGPARSEAG
jgi:hypothetical protein